LRYDQFMKFGWKVLIPASLIWIMVEAAIEVLDRKQLIWGIGTVAILVIAASFVYDSVEQGKQRELDAEAEVASLAPFDPYAGGFPVPPMPGQHLPSRRPVPILAGSAGSAGSAEGVGDGRDDDGRDHDDDGDDPGDDDGPDRPDGPDGHSPDEVTRG
jgi:NADH-quinone oxidoreductase subunit H